MIQPELKAYRGCSDRHVLVLETNLTYVEKCQIFHYADLVRKAGNELTGIMKKRYDQLVRTKRYRKLKTLYKKYKDADNKKALKNLAERGSCIEVNERKERRIYRAMDRSRRAMNPDNYNEDGTIKKGKKTWVLSNRYKKLRTKHTELCRINVTNRHLAIHEDVNELRSLGDVFVTETKNAKKLQKKAKTGKRKKRFGRSIKNRCPGYFQSQAKRKFRIYVEVPNDYKASQYDHTSDEYIKKSLSQICIGFMV